MGKKRVRVDQLRIGMLVADDVYTSTDQLIIPKKSIINEKLIAKLQLYNIPAISVLESKIETSQDENVVLTNSERIRNGEEFKKFHEEFSKASTKLENTFGGLKEKELSNDDIDSMMAVTTELLEGSRSNAHIFDMLHNMRDLADTIYTHSVNVSLISAILGKWLRWPEEEIEILSLSGLLHDIGKLMVPENILLKPYKLSEKEYAIIKSHTVKGYHMLKDMDINKHVKYAALMHHERCDGRGYPMGFTGDKIDRFAKVVAIADVYDAMTSSRVYRESICPFEVISIFESDGLHLYEIEYIMTFLKNIANTYIHNQVRLSNGNVGEIIMLNNNSLAKPVVRVGADYVDLSKEADLKIEAIL